MRILLDSLPTNADQMRAMLASDPTNDCYVAALVVAALSRYPQSALDCEGMLDVLKGPEPLSPYEKQFLKDRFEGKPYLANSYFEGATPQNGYTPAVPYACTVEKATEQEEGWSSLLLKSSGADSPRFVRLRQKRSTGEWFLNEQMLLAGIRIPEAEDPWA